ncbi:MAG: DUF4337 family protein [Acetobacteraceae bacterium]
MAHPTEHAQEAVHHEAHHGGGRSMRSIAVLVSCLAAALALIGVGEKRSQNEYLTHHIALTNDWAFYQAKNLRSVVRGSEANLLEILGRPDDPKVAAKIRDAQAYIARMRDEPSTGEGMKQLAEKAKLREAQRDVAFHAYHNYEYAASAVEIAIVLASVSALTSVPALAIAAAVIGAGAGAFAIATALHLV